MSSFEDVRLQIFGKEHTFSRAICSQIEPASYGDAEAIFHLSSRMPPIYQNKFSPKEQAFRPLKAYRRLLVGREEKRQHDFFVFKDEDGEVQGYIHGMVHPATGKATIDELVVHPKWKGKGVSVTLIGKLMEKWNSRGVRNVDVSIRMVLPKHLAEPFDLKPRESGYDLSLIMDHFVARFSLETLMRRKPDDDTLYRDVAAQIKEILLEAKRRDPFALQEALTYLNELDRFEERYFQKRLKGYRGKMEREIKKVKDRMSEKNPSIDAIVAFMKKEVEDQKEDVLDEELIWYLEDKDESGRNRTPYYPNIQDDMMDQANIYFLFYMLSCLVGADPNATPKEKDYFSSRKMYLEDFAIGKMRLARNQGGQYPFDIQNGIGRVYAFARIFEEEVFGGARKGSEKDLEWVTSSIHEYLRLFDFTSINGRTVFVGTNRIKIITPIREMLWFRYPFAQAKAIAIEWMDFRRRAVEEFRKLKGTDIRQSRAIELYFDFRRSVWTKHAIELHPSWGLLFLFSLPIFDEQDKMLHYRFGDLFGLASFYDYDASKNRWREWNGRLTDLMIRHIPVPLGVEENGELEYDDLDDARLEGILKLLERPLIKDEEPACVVLPETMAEIKKVEIPAMLESSL